MSTTTTHPTTAVPPALEELERLTEVPDQRVVFRGVDWAFYEQLVGSIPDGSNIHVDFDGKDLEIMANGPDHEDIADTLGKFISVVAEEFAISFKAMRQTTWHRPHIARGLEADQCYYFQPEKIAAYARWRGKNDVSLCPNPDLAIEVDISRPEIDRAGIYATLGVPEVWRFDNTRIIIERLTPAGVYVAVEASGFLPVRAEEIRRWVIDEDVTDDMAWMRRLRAEIRTRAASQT